MSDPRAEKALQLIVAWFDASVPTTPEQESMQDAWLEEGLKLAREIVGSDKPSEA